MTRLTDEQIAAIRDGTEGGTPGAWCLSKTSRWPRVVAILPERVDVAATTNDYDAAHIARCDPDTIRALASELLERRAAEAARPRTGDELQRRLRDGWRIDAKICHEAADALAAKDAALKTVLDRESATQARHDEAMAAKDAEIARLRDLFRLDFEQNAAHIRGLTERHAQRTAKYHEAFEVEKFRATAAEAREAEALAKVVTLTARVAELEAALVKAHGGLKAGIAQYASRDFHGNEVAGDEQYPWIRAMQIGRDAARAALGKDKETSHEP